MVNVSRLCDKIQKIQNGFFQALERRVFDLGFEGVRRRNDDRCRLDFDLETRHLSLQCVSAVLITPPALLLEFHFPETSRMAPDLVTPPTALSSPLAMSVASSLALTWAIARLTSSCGPSTSKTARWSSARGWTTKTSWITFRNQRSWQLAATPSTCSGSWFQVKSTGKFTTSPRKIADSPLGCQTSCILLSSNDTPLKFLKSSDVSLLFIIIIRDDEFTSSYFANFWTKNYFFNFFWTNQLRVSFWSAWICSRFLLTLAWTRDCRWSRWTCCCISNWFIKYLGCCRMKATPCRELVSWRVF